MTAHPNQNSELQISSQQDLKVSGPLFLSHIFMVSVLDRHLKSCFFEKGASLSITFNKVAGKVCNLTKSNFPAWVFSPFLNCTNVTKSCKTSQMFTNIVFLFSIYNTEKEQP